MRLFAVPRMRGSDQERSLFNLQETLREVHVQEEIAETLCPVAIGSEG
jgi:hypothetical protein